MAFPAPVPGLVIRYSYLWRDEFLSGQDEGRKDRPCVIVAAIRITDQGEVRALVLPVTHTPPGASGLAVEIPSRVKERLQLDDARSWVVLSEWNEFAWPGPDVRSRPGTDEIAYGVLPPAMFASIRDAFVAAIEADAARQVRRT